MEYNSTIKKPKKLFSDKSKISVNYIKDLKLFLNILSEVTPKNVTPEELVFIIKLLSDDIELGECKFYHSSSIQELFDEYMKKKNNFPIVLTFLPNYINDVASEEFASDFNELYKSIILQTHKTEEPKEEVFECIEIEKNIIDISKKDKAEILAGLYNNSHPQGMGIMQYDTREMTKEIAEKILTEHTMRFSYLKGRTMYISLYNDETLQVYAYNHENGQGLAQRVISKCKDYEKPKKYVLKK